MSRLNLSPIFAAAAFIAFASCSDGLDKVETPAEESFVTELNFSGTMPQTDPESRTEFAEGTIHWSAGDKIAIAFTVNDVWQNASGNANGDAVIYKSTALPASAETATFKVPGSFKDSIPGIRQFYGVYPAPSSTSFPAAPSLSVTIPYLQKPSAESFDAAGDLMVGKATKTYSESPVEAIPMMWSRVVAHAHIILKNVPWGDAENVSSVTITGQDSLNIAGNQNIDITTGAVTPRKGSVNYVVVDTENIPAKGEDGTYGFWFCLLPAEFTSITVRVETNEAFYTKTYSGISRIFDANVGSSLGINMNGAEVEMKSQLVQNGLYVIAFEGKAGTGETIHRQMMLANSGNFQNSDDLETATDESGRLTPSNEDAVWDVLFDSGSGKYSIRSVGMEKYLAADNTNLKLVDDVSLFNISSTDPDNNVFKIDAGGERSIGFNYNNGNPRFSMYQGSAAQPITIKLLPAFFTVVPTVFSLTTGSAEINPGGEEVTLSASYSLRHLISLNATATFGFDYGVSVGEDSELVSGLSSTVAAGSSADVESGSFSAAIAIAEGNKYHYRAWVSFDGGETKTFAGETKTVFIPEGAAQYTLLFGPAYNGAPAPSYVSSWTVTKDGFKWEIENFANNSNSWDYIRAGQKKAKTADPNGDTCKLPWHNVT